MRCLCLLGLAVVWFGPPACAAAPAPSASSALVIEVQPGDWGKTSVADIRAVVCSAGGEIWRHCPNTHLDPICVRYSAKTPITHFARDQDGGIVVGLNARGTYWAQFAYQFAHEFGHVLAAQAGDASRKWRNTGHANHWFEESLCETASLFALKAMAQTWTTNPPYPNWKSFAPKLLEYADKLLQEPPRQLAAGQNFQPWFHASEPSLRTNATQRAKNGIVAAQLLPLFEQNPSGWEALVWLNLGTRDPKLPFRTYLAEWRAACPASHRPFVEKLAAAFGLEKLAD